MLVGNREKTWELNIFPMGSYEFRPFPQKSVEVPAGNRGGKPRNTVGIVCDSRGLPPFPRCPYGFPQETGRLWNLYMITVGFSRLLLLPRESVEIPTVTTAARGDSRGYRGNRKYRFGPQWVPAFPVGFHGNFSGIPRELNILPVGSYWFPLSTRDSRTLWSWIIRL